MPIAIEPLIACAAMVDAAPRISVIVPFLESADTLEACALSLLGQTGVDGDVEVFLVDNSPADPSPAETSPAETSPAETSGASAAIAERLASEHARLTLLREPTPGAYAARNAGLRAVRGEIVAFTDADCTVEPGWLRAIHSALSDPTIGVVLGRCRYPREASWPLRLLGAYENAKTDYVLTRCSPAHRFAYTNNMAVRGTLFEEIGPFEEWRRAGDSEWVHRLATRRPDLRVVYEPSMTIVHHEFLEARQRLRRLRLYTGTNTQIDSFRELGIRRRLAAMVHGLVRKSLFF